MDPEADNTVHILVVEDNPINQKLARYMLTKAGYRVTIAKDGEEGLQSYTANSSRFDLIFMDIQMPRMNGLEATRRIRETEHTGGTFQLDLHIPIIAMTAQSMKGDREKCLEAGMDDYIAKPIKKELVLEAVKKWLPGKA
ncbi:MAG: response regulator [bacterium]|nr:response regulator [bacterium]